MMRVCLTKCQVWAAFQNSGCTITLKYICYLILVFNDKHKYTDKYDVRENSRTKSANTKFSGISLTNVFSKITLGKKNMYATLAKKHCP